MPNSRWAQTPVAYSYRAKSQRRHGLRMFLHESVSGASTRVRKIVALTWQSFVGCGMCACINARCQACPWHGLLQLRLMDQVFRMWKSAAARAHVIGLSAEVGQQQQRGAPVGNLCNSNKAAPITAMVDHTSWVPPTRTLLKPPPQVYHASHTNMQPSPAFATNSLSYVSHILQPECDTSSVDS